MTLQSVNNNSALTNSSTIKTEIADNSVLSSVCSLPSGLPRISAESVMATPLQSNYLSGSSLANTSALLMSGTFENNKNDSQKSVRIQGAGITTPVMIPSPLGLKDNFAQFGNSQVSDAARDQKIVITADHNGREQALRVQDLLKKMGIHNVNVIIPSANLNRKSSYTAYTAAGVGLLNEGKVDRVISFCGNGRGALDVLNAYDYQHAHSDTVYADNLPSIISSQQSAKPALKMAMGARLTSQLDAQTLSIYLRAFVENKHITEQALLTSEPSLSNNLIQGWASRLEDPKGTRVAKRQLNSASLDSKPLWVKESLESNPLGGIDVFNHLSMTDLRNIVNLQSNLHLVVAENDPLALQQAQNIYGHFSSVAPGFVQITQMSHKNLTDVVENFAQAKVPVIAFSSHDFIAAEEGAWSRPVKESTVSTIKPQLWRDALDRSKVAPDRASAMLINSLAWNDSATNGQNLDALKLVAKTFLLQPQTGENKASAYSAELNALDCWINSKDQKNQASRQSSDAPVIAEDFKHAQSQADVIGVQNTHAEVPDKASLKNALIKAAAQLKNSGNGLGIMFSPMEMPKGLDVQMLKATAPVDEVKIVQIDARPEAGEGKTWLPSKVTWRRGAEEWAALVKDHTPEKSYWLHLFSVDDKWVTNTVQNCLAINPRLAGVYVQINDQTVKDQGFTAAVQEAQKCTGFSSGVKIGISIDAGSLSRADNEEIKSIKLNSELPYQITSSASGGKGSTDAVSITSKALSQLQKLTGGAAVGLDRRVNQSVLNALGTKPDSATLGKAMLQSNL